MTSLGGTNGFSKARFSVGRGVAIRPLQNESAPQAVQLGLVIPFIGFGDNSFGLVQRSERLIGVFGCAERFGEEDEICGVILPGLRRPVRGEPLTDQPDSTLV